MRLYGTDMATIPDLAPYFNNNNLGLSFKFHFDSHGVSFLDIIIVGNFTTAGVETATYRKEIAGNTILYASSCQPTSYHQSYFYWRPHEGKEELFHSDLLPTREKP